MYYFINAMIKDSVEKVINAEQQTKDKVILKIESFADPMIYRSIASMIISHLKQKNINNYCIKLSQREFEKLFNDCSDSYSEIKSFFEDSDLVADKSITFYRNLQNYQYIFLLGTENEEDSSGLSNIKSITPVDLQHYFYSESDNKYEFHKMFCQNDAQDSVSSDFISVIDRLYKDLFSLVDFNFLKFTKTVQEYLNRIDNDQYIMGNIADFLDFFYQNLEEWGLGPIYKNIPPLRDINKTNKNLLETEFSFFNRTKSFKSYNVAKLKKTIDDFNLDLIEDPNGHNYKEKYSPEWFETTCFSDFQELYQSIEKYVLHGDVFEKDRLQKIDYSIIADIFGIKTLTDTSPRLPKDNVNMFRGDPFEVFLKAIVKFIQSQIADKRSYDSYNLDNPLRFCITLTKIELKCWHTNNEEDEDKDKDTDDLLQDSWERLCVYLGGVLDYINKSFKNNGIGISVSLDRYFFKPYDSYLDLRNDGVLVSASDSSKFNRISFEVIQSDCDEPFKCLWSYSDKEPWFSDFSLLMDERLINNIKLIKYLEENFELGITENNKKYFFPVFLCKEMSAINAARDEEEFYNSYNQLDLKCCNLYDLIEKSKKISKPKNNLLSDFGLITKSFFDKLLNQGFYSVITDEDNTAEKYIHQYNEFSKYLINTDLSDDLGFLFANSFVIVQGYCDYNELFSLDRIPSVLRKSDTFIVPAWHPAAVEKIVKQREFLMLGLAEKLRKVFSQSDALKNEDLTDFIKELHSLTKYPRVLDVMVSGNGKLLECSQSYGNISVYSNRDSNDEQIVRMRDVVKKEMIYDEDFTISSSIVYNDDAKMYYEIITKYLSIFPDYYNNLSLVFINPSDLQPIVAMINHYSNEFCNQHDGLLNISLKIYSHDNNLNGKNYLKSWLDENLNIDGNVNIKTYLNSWISNMHNNSGISSGNNNGGLLELIGDNNDIIFVMNHLCSKELSFLKDFAKYSEHSPNDCLLFPLSEPFVNKKNRGTRKIEYSLKQFNCSYLHSLLVNCLHSDLVDNPQCQTLYKVLEMNESMANIIPKLHAHGNFVVCIDSKMDELFLKNSENDNFSIIGYMTGKGIQGNSNITISTRSSVQKSLFDKFKKRLQILFSWSSDIAELATQSIFDMATKLDGISIFNSIRENNYAINEFLAYVLTALYQNKKSQGNDLEVLIHLDSYKHWFNFDETNENLRPDFLLLSVKDTDRKLKIFAQVIECKLSMFDKLDDLFVKAEQQVSRGLEVLMECFDPLSISIKSKYWFVQLYKALQFAQISFNSDNNGIDLKKILDGNFEINWSGSIYGFAVDYDQKEPEFLRSSCFGYETIKFPQMYIKNLLLEYQSENEEYSVIDQSLMLDERESESDEGIIEDDFNIDTSDFYVHPTIDQNENIGTQQKLFTFPNEDKESEKNSPLEVIDDVGVSSQTTDGNSSIIQTALSSKNESNCIEQHTNLENVRVLIGKSTRRNEPIYWEFGNRNLQNRHLLITGTSGSGKTYSIQALMYEVAKNNIPIVVFDYSKSFALDQLNSKFKDLIGNKLIEHNISRDGISINPFAVDESEPEHLAIRHVPGRIADIFSHVFKFGQQQHSVIYQSVSNAIKNKGKAVTIDDFKTELSNMDSSIAESVSSKMIELFDWSDLVFKNHATKIDWNDILYSPSANIHVFQLEGFPDQLKNVLVEVFLWELWFFVKRNHGNESKPFCVVLDEAQNLSHKSTSPSAKILTEGRKFGWSAWYATQSLKVLSDDEVTRLNQADTRLFFKPTQQEVVPIAKLIYPSEYKVHTEEISNLEKGLAIFDGSRVLNNKLMRSKPTPTKITSLEDRL